MLEIHHFDKEFKVETFPGYVGKIIYFKDTKKAAYVYKIKEKDGDSIHFSWLENNLYVQIEYLIRSNEITLKERNELAQEKFDNERYIPKMEPSELILRSDQSKDIHQDHIKFLWDLWHPNEPLNQSQIIIEDKKENSAFFMDGDGYFRNPETGETNIDYYKRMDEERNKDAKKD